MAEIIDGKKLAEDIKLKIRQEIVDKKLTPHLAVILVGNDPASQIYVGLKKRACEQVGIEFHEYLITASCQTKDILETIEFLNNDKDVDAILVQLPLPKHLDTDEIIRNIKSTKDVDGFHPANIKKLLNNQTDFIPGLPLGIIKLLESTNENLANKQAVIIAKSEVFYQPLAKLLQNKKIKTEIINPQDKNLSTKTKQADILITAVGQPFFIKADMVKKDVIIIDIGTNKIDNKYIVGDVDYSDVFPKTRYITPVPGGVGPMTVAMLLYNTVQLAKQKTTA